MRTNQSLTLLPLLLALTTAQDTPPTTTAIRTTRTVLPPPDAEVSGRPVVVCSAGTATIGFCTMSVSCGVPYGGCTSHCAGFPAPTFIPPADISQACATWTEPAATITDVVYLPHTTFPVEGRTWWLDERTGSTVTNRPPLNGTMSTTATTDRLPGSTLSSSTTTNGPPRPTETPEGDDKEDGPPTKDEDNAGVKVGFGVMGVVPALVVAGAVGFMW